MPGEEGQPVNSATEMVTDIHSKMSQLFDLMRQAGTEEGDLAGMANAIKAFEGAVEGLGAPAGAQPPAQPQPNAPSPAAPATSTPEAGVAQVRQAL